MDNLTRHFGLIIAYLLPGFITLAGIAPLFPPVRRWLSVHDQISLGLGPTLYTLLAALAAGMIVSCFRWLLIDHLLHATGFARPRWKTLQLQSRLSEFSFLVESYYRYYQFYANGLLALGFSYVVNRVVVPLPGLSWATDMLMLIVLLVLLAGARDALSNYYQAMSALMAPVAENNQVAS